jgi:hypothetical protein
MREIVKATLLCGVLIMGVVAQSPAMADTRKPLDEPTLAEAEASAARADREFSRELELLSAVIRSAEDLEVYLAMGGDKRGPFRHLRDSELSTFLESLRFGPVALGSFDHNPIERLTPSQAYEILSLFGVQEAIGTLRFGEAQTDFDREVLEHFSTLPPSPKCIQPPPEPLGGDGASTKRTCPGQDRDCVRDSRCTNKQCIGSASTTGTCCDSRCK